MLLNIHKKIRYVLVVENLQIHEFSLILEYFRILRRFSGSGRLICVDVVANKDCLNVGKGACNTSTRCRTEKQDPLYFGLLYCICRNGVCICIVM
jgi:hypothetical protein